MLVESCFMLQRIFLGHRRRMWHNNILSSPDPQDTEGELCWAVNDNLSQNLWHFSMRSLCIQLFCALLLQYFQNYALQLHLQEETPPHLPSHLFSDCCCTLCRFCFYSQSRNEKLMGQLLHGWRCCWNPKEQFQCQNADRSISLLSLCTCLLG